MIRIILFLALIAALAAGAAWVADQPGDVVLSWSGWRAETSLPVFVLGIGIVVAVPLLVALKIVCQRVEGWDWFAHLLG